MLKTLITGPPSLAQAVRGGGAADHVGYALAAGYQAALRALVPGLPDGAVASLAVTEVGGAHPRAIQASLSPAFTGWSLSGRKAFVTQAHQASVFLVLASAGAGQDGRALLRLVRVAREAPGLSLQVAAQTPFCPEIGHAELHLHDVAVAEAELIPGDGWADLVKPFRTVEDVHVFAAVLAHVHTMAARHGAPRAALEELCALVLVFAALAARDPDAPQTHIALAGAIAQAHRTLDAHASLWERVPEDERARWHRDQPLLRVAEKARAARLEAAWKRLGGLA